MESRLLFDWLVGTFFKAIIKGTIKMSEFNQAIWGNTDLQVGRLGLAASYGAPAGAFEEAFDKGFSGKVNI